MGGLPKRVIYVPKEHLTVSNEHFLLEKRLLPLDSILFIDKEYPTHHCGRKYLTELGCLWCNVYSKYDRNTT